MAVCPFIISRQVNYRAVEPAKERQVIGVNIIRAKRIACLDVTNVHSKIQLVPKAIDIVDDVDVLAITWVLLSGAYLRKVRLIPQHREVVREILCP